MSKQIRIAVGLFGLALFITLSRAYADEDPQCSLIANLTGDYYLHRVEGLSKQEVIEQFQPDFVNAEFQRVMELAINMAFAVDGGQSREQVVESVYSKCMLYQK